MDSSFGSWADEKKRLVYGTVVETSYREEHPRQVCTARTDGFLNHIEHPALSSVAHERLSAF